MARKDFEEYYAKIKTQYSQLVRHADEAGKLAAENMVDPDVVNNLNAIMTPVKNSYMTLAYVEYLLNLPKDKKTLKRNERQFQAQLQKIEEKYKNKVDENNQALNAISTIIEEEFK